MLIYNITQSPLKCLFIHVDSTLKYTKHEIKQDFVVIKDNLTNNMTLRLPA